MSANPEDKLLKNSTVVSINATLQNILTALTTQNSKLDTQNANIAAWAGNLSQLTTGEKTSLVGAINWLKTQHDDKTLTLTEHINTSAMHDVYDYLDSVSTAENGAAIHNSLPRCKNLGAALTTEQHDRIADHTFKGLWLGDYIGKQITFDSITAEHVFRFWDFDYRLRCGDQGSGLQDGHILGGPDKVFLTARMNSSNTTSGGYPGSEMWSTHLPKALNAFKALVGEDHILSYRAVFPNAITDGCATGYAWYTRQLDLLCEPMVYGGYHFRPGNKGTTEYRLYEVDTQQLSLFRLCKGFSFIRANWYWLRDVVSGSLFATVSTYGSSSYNTASYAAGGVRPLILFK